MNIPPGYTEEQVLGSIERVVKFLSSSFAFGYYDADDIAQEGRIFGLESLERYKPELGSLDTFLKLHISNRLLNLRRDKLARLQVPCLNCEFYKKECTKYTDKLDCSRWILWTTRNTTKRSLMEPTYEDMGCMVQNRDKNISEIYCQSELVEIIDEHIPINMRKDFRRLLEGVTIQKFRHDKLILKINEILQQYYHGENWYS